VSLPFPRIDPVALALGPLKIRWYALAYLAGILLGWRYAITIVRRQVFRPNAEDIEEFMSWVVLGIILGGRIGYVLVYQTGMILSDPLEMLKLWHGGMSFHGGMTGLGLAMYIFARRRGIAFFALTDVVGCVTPIGLFFGRIANFINGELWGRVTDVPWAMAFPGPRAGDLPRHPSQLYEAGLEGIALFCLMNGLRQVPAIRDRHGMLTGIFLVWYACSRILIECFREPDAQMGYYFGGVTMGQILSLPMIVLGLFLIWLANHRYVRPAPAEVEPA
jgi:phosphatidylglycerol:prolipoprotein diacylglycerol transferase